MKNLSECELLKLHMDCMFTYEEERMVSVNEPWGASTPAPLLFAGRTIGGEISWRFGREADDAFMEKAQALLTEGVWDLSVYRTKLQADGFSEEACFFFPHSVSSFPGSRLLNPPDLELLAQSFPECAEELDTALPYAACFLEGKIVSICRSVRRGLGQEAGIETLPACRRNGYALSALHCWTHTLQEEGLVPLYSAELSNQASLQLAGKAGFVPYAQGFQIWRA